jgi:cytochrome c oxidase assembly protein subunit 15
MDFSRQSSSEPSPLASQKLNPMQQAALATVLATIFLIFVGGLVRASGAGLGCPDWPRCWGHWWPPSEVSQIDATRYDLTLFNPVKMWTEYVNRLIGVTIGLFVLTTAALSWGYRKTRPVVFYGSLGSVALVVFEGWLGGMVVRSGLKPGMVTLHMFAAVVLVCLLLYVTFRATEERWTTELPEALRGRLLWVGLLLLGCTLVQVVIGSQVREALTHVAETLSLPRSEWIDEIGWLDHVHRSFSWVILLAGVYLAWIVFRRETPPLLRKLCFGTLAIMLAQIFFGVLLVYGGMPWPMQLLHTGTSAVLVCAECLLLLQLRNPRKNPLATTPPLSADHPAFSP